MDTINSLPDQRMEHSPTSTSSSYFLRSLQEFLDRNQIDSIGHFQIRVQHTSDNISSLLVEGEINSQAGLDWTWPQMGPIDDAFAEEQAGTKSSSDGGPASSSESLSERDLRVDGNELSLNRDLDSPLAASDPIFPFLSPSTFPSSSITGTTEAPSLVLPFFELIDPTVVASQGQLTETFAPDYNASTTFYPNDDPATASTLSSTSKGAGCKASKKDSRPCKRRRSTNTWDDTTELIVKSLSQNILCENFYDFLEAELPGWAREGLWHEAHQKVPTARDTLPSPSSYSKLERAYLAVCQLDSRMSNDLVRNRMALVQLHLEYTETYRVCRQTSASNRTTSSRGRGEASHVIDQILENLHPGWKVLDQRRRAELRLKFHDRKKYGKRWAQLASALGPGILLICSPKLANAVKSTTITAKMLEGIAERVEASAPDAAKIIGIVSPLAGGLLKNERCDHFDAAQILREIQSFSRSLVQE